MLKSVLKLFGNLKTEEFPENLSKYLSEKSINKAFLLLNKYLNIKQVTFFLKKGGKFITPFPEPRILK